MSGGNDGPRAGGGGPAAASSVDAGAAGLDPRLLERFLELAPIEGLSGREGAVAAHLRAALEELGLAVHEDGAAAVTGGESGNLLCRLGAGGENLLTAHLDTAASTAGLVPVVDGDRVRSDGTTILGADNRAGVALLLYTAERAMRGGGDAWLAFTVCEETTLGGSRHLELPAGVRRAFVFDSSLPPGHLVTAAHGARRFRIEVEGRAAHAGLAPEEGVDAIALAVRALAQLPGGRLDAETTVNIGRLVGGTALNVVPAALWLEGEVRGARQPVVDAVVERYRRRFADEAERAGARVQLTSSWDFEPYALAPGSEVLRRATAAVRAAGLQPVAATSPGGSDANAFNARGLPAVNLGVGARDPHSTREHILLADLAAAARIARALVSGP